MHEDLRKCPTLINRGKVKILHNNTRPHSVRITKEKKLNLDWSVLLHPPYLPDLAPNDFHLFHFQQNALNNKKFSQEDQVEMFVENFLSSKPAEFYLRDINKLPEKW